MQYGIFDKGQPCGHNNHIMRQRPRRTVGARELKTRLGTYLRQVQHGTTLIVTERGRPVAELRPLSIETLGEEARLDELVALGLLSRETKIPFPPFQPIRPKGGLVSTAIIEDREERF